MVGILVVVFVLLTLVVIVVPGVLLSDCKTLLVLRYVHTATVQCWPVYSKDTSLLEQLVTSEGRGRSRGGGGGGGGGGGRGSAPLFLRRFCLFAIQIAPE